MAGLRKSTRAHVGTDDNRLSRLVLSFGYALAGLRDAWRHSRNFRIEATIGIAALVLAWWLDANAVPVLLAGALVLGLELVNSALEAVVDLVSPGRHPLAGRAKDLAAGAVLLAAVNAILIGLLVMGPPLWERLFGV
ncbi:MAG TPA: diacylglycerol kinase [Trueperaceae bacterium]